MQGRMKEHQLTTDEVGSVLEKTTVGHLGSINENGFPYVVPVHFVYDAGHIYIHGLNQGQKLDNIKTNPKICFETSEMLGLILDNKACDVNTSYNSVVIFGTATTITDTDKKIDVLNKVVKKYTPHLSGQVYPENMMKGTGIIDIAISEMTGKYYK